MLEGGRRVVVARSLEMSDKTLSNWVRRVRKGKSLSSRKPPRVVTDLEAELSRLRTENAQWKIGQGDLNKCGGEACESQTDYAPHAAGGDPSPGALSAALCHAIPARVSDHFESSCSAVCRDNSQSGLGARHHVCGHGRRVGGYGTGDGSVFQEIGGWALKAFVDGRLTLTTLHMALGRPQPELPWCITLIEACNMPPPIARCCTGGGSHSR